MERSAWLYAVPLVLVAAVLVIAPPASLIPASDKEKAANLGVRPAKPEPVPLPPGIVADATPADITRPALPRTVEEWRQARKALKDRENMLRRRRFAIGANDRASLQVLAEEITRYNEDLSLHEKQAAQFEIAPTPM